MAEVMADKPKMDFHWTIQDMSMWPHGCEQYKWRLVHKLPDKGLDIFLLCMPSCLHSSDLWYIPVCNSVVHQCNLVDMNTPVNHSNLYNWSLVHMVLDSMGLVCRCRQIVEELRIRHTFKIQYLRKVNWKHTWWRWITSSEGITNETHFTSAYRTVVVNSTRSVQATNTRTWITTLLINACFVKWTFRTDKTFGTTRRRTSNVALLTRADSLMIHFTTLTIRSTWGWFTWIYVNGWIFCMLFKWYYMIKVNKNATLFAYV